MKDKVVCYSCTREWYDRLKVAIYSLLANNPDIDEVVCFIQDDELPFEHNKIRTINVDAIPCPFWKESDNYKTKFTPLSLYRLAYSKILDEEYHKVLHLDVDTIVDADISELFDENMTDIAVCGVDDVVNHLKVNPYYFNSGVLLLNLDYIRENKLDDESIRLINGPKLLYADQDVLNIVTTDHVKRIPAIYNDFVALRRTFKPKIYHYAGLHDWERPESMGSFIWNDYKEQADGLFR